MRTPSRTPAIRQCALIATFFTLLLISFQLLTVTRNYNGNWTALFCTGDARPVPPSLRERTYVFPNSTGYDGQFYRYVAHDPLMNGEAHRSIDNLGVRYRRIFVPGLAFLLARGRPGAIDVTYLALIWASVWLGCFWSSRLALDTGLHPAWGGLFLLVPATLTSMDRLTIDVTLAALTAQFIWLVRAKHAWAIWITVCAAPLVRETGFLLLAAVIMALVLDKQIRAAATFLLASVPALVWYAYVNAHVPQAALVPRWVSQAKWGPFWRIFNPVSYDLQGAVAAWTSALDTVALCGMIVLFAATLLLIPRFTAAPDTIAAVLFTLLIGVALNGRFWDSVYGYSRPFSPLFILLATCRRTRLLAVAACFAVSSRILWQLGPQILGIIGVRPG